MNNINWNAELVYESNEEEEKDNHLIMGNASKSKDDLEVQSKWIRTKSLLNLKRIQRNAVMEYIRRNRDCNCQPLV